MVARRTTIAMAALVALAAVPRAFRLGGQVLVGDERWDVAAALERPIGALFRDFVISGANHSPPLSALIRTMFDAGIEPGEAWLRVPSLVFGLATVVVLPMGLSRRIGREATFVFGALLALSPLLILYSRLVRGYALLVLLTGLAWILFLRWEERRSSFVAIAHACIAGLAVDVHLLALPFVLTPFVASFVSSRLIERSGDPADRPPLSALAAMAVLTLLGIGLWLAPAHEAIAWLLERRSGVHRPDLGALLGTAARLAGTTSWPMALVFYALAGRGLHALWRTRRRLAVHAAFGIGLPTIAVAALGPAGIERAVLFTRYVLPVLPLVLLLVAVGLTAPISPIGLQRLRAESWPLRPRLVGAAAVLAFSVALVATGPLVGRGFRDRSFAHALAFERWDVPPPLPPPIESADFLRSLDRPGRGGPVVETLWHGVLFPDVARAEARLHGQPVIVASLLDRWWDDPRLALRTAADPAPAALLAGRGRWLVVHRRPIEETLLMHDDDPAVRRLFETLDGFARSYARATSKALRRYEGALGKADYTDAWIAVWDLERVRVRASGAPTPGGA